MSSIKILLIGLLIALSQAEIKLVANEFTEQSFTDKDVINWKVQGNYMGQLTSMCQNKALFGGYNVFGINAEASKSFDSGVDHSKLFISFDLFLIDSWENEVFSVFLDGVQVSSFKTYHLTPSERTVSCGFDIFSDRINTMSIAVPHFRRDFTLKLTSNLNQLANDESWGIRNLLIYAEYDIENISVITEEFLKSNFTSSLDGWKLIGVTQGKEFSSVNNTTLFGGYLGFGKDTNAIKSFNNLKDHLGLIINLDLWIFDSPEYYDVVQIIIDNQVYSIQRPDWNYYDVSSQIGGVAGISDRIVSLSIFVPHIGLSVTIQIKGKYDELLSNESFGVQNLRILMSSCSNASCSIISNEFSGQVFTNGENWKSEDGKDLSNQTRICNTTSYFGSHQSNILKKISNISSHTGVRIFFRLLTTTALWDQTKIAVLIDDVNTNPTVAKQFIKSKICDNSDESIIHYYLDVAHNNDILEFKIIFKGASTLQTFSIRDLIITAYSDTKITLFTKEFTNQSFSSVANWTVSGQNQGIVTSNCGKQSLFGGFNLFGQKTKATKIYSGLPLHNYLLLTFNLFFIDTWEREDFTVTLDNNIVLVKTKSDTWGGDQYLCGIQAQEEAVFVSIYYPHTSDKVLVGLKDSLDQSLSDESWGIRNFIISTGLFPVPQQLTRRSIQSYPPLPPIKQITCPLQALQTCTSSLSLCPQPTVSSCPPIQEVTCPQPIIVPDCPAVQIPICPSAKSTSISLPVEQTPAPTVSITSIPYVDLTPTPLTQTVDPVIQTPPIQTTPVPSVEINSAPQTETVDPVELAPPVSIDPISEQTTPTSSTEEASPVEQALDNSANCIIIYSECEYEGNHLRICEGFQKYKSQLPWREAIRSIQIPLGKKLIIQKGDLSYIKISDAVDSDKSAKNKQEQEKFLKDEINLQQKDHNKHYEVFSESQDCLDENSFSLNEKIKGPKLIKLDNTLTSLKLKKQREI